MSGLREQLQFVAGAESHAVPPKRRAILVLGMHRSGTSALGGALKELGAAAPKTLLAPRPDNPKGFFESAALAHAHDALLESAGSCWDDWRCLDSRIGPDIADQHRQKIKAVLTDEFDDARLIFIKDPRMCRFVPFTLSLLAELNISATAILPIRNPLEVAHSLKRRNDFSLSKSLLLWLRHVLDAEFNSRGLPRYFLPYERFLNDWQHYMDHAAEKIGLNWPARFDLSAAERIERFLTADLYREKASVEDLQNHPNATASARQAYEILMALGVDGENADFLRQLDQIRNRFDEDCEKFGKVLESEFAVRRLRNELEVQARRAAVHGNSVAPIRVRPITDASRIAERDSVAMAPSSVIDAREAIAASKVHRLKAEQDTLVADLRAQIAERDMLVADLNSRIAEREKSANVREAELASAVKRLTMERDNLAKLLAARQSELDDLKVECTRLTELAEARELQTEHECNLLTVSLNAAVEERDAIAAARNSLEIAHNGVLSSRSWRVTAPLRFVRGLFG